MASRDEDFGADLALTEGNDAIWSPSGPAPGREARDWRSLYEQAHARAERECSRADAAEARAEELRWAEVDARGRAGSLKWQLDRCRNKLKAAVEETKDVRRTAKNALSLQAESHAAWRTCFPKPASSRPGAGRSQRRTRRRAGCVATLERAENQKTTIESLRAERGELRKEVTRLNREVARLGKRLAREEQASERHKETIRRQYDEDIQLRATLRRLREQVGQGSVAVGRGLLAAPCPGRRQGRERGHEGQACQASRGEENAVQAPRGSSAACGAQEIMAPEADDQVTVEGDSPAAQGRSDVGGCQGPGCQASRGQGDADEGVVRQDHPSCVWRSEDHGARKIRSGRSRRGSAG